ncbi:cyclase family protein [Micromonospora sp. CPCC 206061]|uniref:cyclase family protein n=1 Tax=Micromonospora sp. CPCC 206061 TaxID=3122410 RepID=UPI002FF18648
MSRFVDLSHPITGGVGLAGAVDARLTTHVDAPFHQHRARADIGALPPERLVDVPIEVVRAAGAALVTAADLGPPDRFWGRAVLMQTGWSRHWGTPGYEAGGPYLASSAVDVLIDANVAAVGIDSYADEAADATGPAHDRLLGHDVPILEHLTNLDRLPDTGAHLFALPPSLTGLGSFPVRAVAVVERRPA